MNGTLFLRAAVTGALVTGIAELPAATEGEKVYSMLPVLDSGGQPGVSLRIDTCLWRDPIDMLGRRFNPEEYSLASVATHAAWSRAAPLRRMDVFVRETRFPGAAAEHKYFLVMAVTDSPI